MAIFPIFMQAGGGGGGIPLFVTLAGMMLIFYLFMILPQQRKQKQQQTFRSSLSKGDDVVTIGGIHGKVHAVDEHTVTLLVDKMKIVFDKQAISSDASQRIQKETTTL